MLIDVNKTPEQNILDLINESSEVQFTQNDLIIGAPVVYTPLTGETSNTVLTITASQSSTVGGSTTVKYKRLDLSKDFQNYPSTFTFEIGMQRPVIISNILANLNINNQAYLDYNFENDNNLTISAVFDDYLYCGSKTLTLVFE